VTEEKTEILAIAKKGGAIQSDAKISQNVSRKVKKKKSYKSMMAGIMNGSPSSKDAEKEKDSLRKVTGGGAFSKVEKI